MSLGANFSSGYTQNLTDNVNQCSVTKSASIATNDGCCQKDLPGVIGRIRPIANYPSMILLARSCDPPTPSNFALYPKTAALSSTRTQSLSSPDCTTFDPKQRFSQYARYQPPIPCQPLPASANMAGISQPSSRLCNT